MSIHLQEIKDLPEGFKYPESFLKVIKLNLINIEPWYIMERDFVITRINGLKKRYPNRNLVPFARRSDNDDIACFELGKEGEVQIIHDFASQGYEQRNVYIDFWEWFKTAIDEMIDFD